MAFIIHDYTGDNSIDIENPIQNAIYAGFNFIRGEARAHRFWITLKNNGSDLSLSGYTPIVYVVRPDGETVIANVGTSGDQITATITSACSAYTGRVYIVAEIVSTDGTQTIPILYLYSNVLDGITDAVVDPGTALPNLAEIVAYVEAHSVYEVYSDSTSYVQYNHVTFDDGNGYSTYMWSSSTPSVAGTDPSESEDWLLVSEHGGAVASDDTPLGNGTAAPGTSNECSRADHIHPFDSGSIITPTALNSFTINTLNRVIKQGKLLLISIDITCPTISSGTWIDIFSTEYDEYDLTKSTMQYLSGPSFKQIRYYQKKLTAFLNAGDSGLTFYGQITVPLL